jgi:hypothetical protein
MFCSDGYLGDEAVQCAHHQFLQFPQAIPFGRVNDAGDDVLPAGNLAVVVGGLGHHLSPHQVHQPDDVAGGADVYGHCPEALQVLARQDVYQARRPLRTVPGIQFHHRRHRPLPLPQGAGEFPQDRQGCLHVAQAVAAGQFPLEAGPVVGLVGQGRGLQGDRELAQRLVVAVVGEREFYLRRALGLLDAALNPLLRRDEDDDVALHQGLAGQRVSGGDVLRGEALGGAAADRPRFHHHGAAAAPPLPAAGHQDVHPGLPGRVAEQGARREPLPASRRDGRRR